MPAKVTKGRTNEQRALAALEKVADSMERMAGAQERRAIAAETTVAQQRAMIDATLKPIMQKMGLI